MLGQGYIFRGILIRLSSFCIMSVPFVLEFFCPILKKIMSVECEKKAIDYNLFCPVSHRYIATEGAKEGPSEFASKSRNTDRQDWYFLIVE